MGGRGSGVYNPSTETRPVRRIAAAFWLVLLWFPQPAAAQKVPGKVCFDTSLEHAKLIAITRDGRLMGIGAGLGLGDSFHILTGRVAAPTWMMKWDIYSGFDNLAAHPELEQIAISDDDVVVVDLAARKKLEEYKTKKAARYVAWRRGGRQLLGLDRENVLYLWDVPNVKPVKAVPTDLGKKAEVLLVDDHEGAGALAVALAGGEVRILDEQTGRTRLSLKAHPNKVDALRFHPDGTLLATSEGETHSLKLWDVASGELKLEVKDPAVWLPKPIRFMAKGSRIVVGDSIYPGCGFRFLDTATGKVVEEAVIFANCSARELEVGDPDSEDPLLVWIDTGDVIHACSYLQVIGKRPPIQVVR